MISAVTALHIFVAFVLMISVLLQTGKGSGLGAAFGGTSSSVFGARGPATLFSKVTTFAAVVFMATSLVLALNARRADTLDLPETVAPPVETPADAAPLPELPALPAAEETGGGASEAALPADDPSLGASGAADDASAPAGESASPSGETGASPPSAEGAGDSASEAAPEAEAGSASSSSDDAAKGKDGSASSAGK
jgi:preprotein translocase subunit SecG